MSIHTAPYKNPNFIQLNSKEHRLINPNKQQGVNQSSDGYCKVCQRPTHYLNQQLCYICRNHLIRGNLFTEYGELIASKDEHKQYYPLVTDFIVNKIDIALNKKFKTRCYKSKTAKMILITKKFIEANGEVEVDVAYRRLKYYADTSQRDSLQKTLQIGRKLFDVLFSYIIHQDLMAQKKYS